MSYHPSHRQPPRQERWPNATPAEGWPSYRDGGGYPGEDRADSRYGADGQDAYPATAGYRQQGGYQRGSGGSPDRGYQSAVITDPFPPTGNGYGPAAGYGYGRADGYDQADGYGHTGGYDSSGGYESAGGYDWTPDGPGAGNGNGYQTGGYPGSGYHGGINGYAGATDSFDGVTGGIAGAAGGYATTVDGYDRVSTGYPGDAGGYDWNENGYGGTADGYAGARDGFGGYAGYPDRAGYAEPALSDPMLTPPDMGAYPGSWQADQELRRDASQRGPMVGAVTELLGTAVVIGVSTLAAALLRSSVSPVAAMGGVFVDRMPAGLRNAVIRHFGAHGRAVLLLGMFAAIAVIALVIGVLARRAPALGVAGIAAFSLFAAFVVVTRPASHTGDIAPAVVGGIAGVAALLWLVHASAPAQGIAPLRHARGGTRRRRR
jgi:hypothetical protein